MFGLSVARTTERPNAKILKTLGAEPFDLSRFDEYFGTSITDRHDPKSVFFMWVGKVLYAAQAHGAKWEECDYKYADDERDANRWLSL